MIAKKRSREVSVDEIISGMFENEQDLLSIVSYITIGYRYTK